MAPTPKIFNSKRNLDYLTNSATKRANFDIDSLIKNPNVKLQAAQGINSIQRLANMNMSNYGNTNHSGPKTSKHKHTASINNSMTIDMGSIGLSGQPVPGTQTGATATPDITGMRKNQAKARAATNIVRDTQGSSNYAATMSDFPRI